MFALVKFRETDKEKFSAEEKQKKKLFFRQLEDVFALRRLHLKFTLSLHKGVFGRGNLTFL